MPMSSSMSVSTASASSTSRIVTHELLEITGTADLGVWKTLRHTATLGAAVGILAFIILRVVLWIYDDGNFGSLNHGTLLPLAVLAACLSTYDRCRAKSRIQYGERLGPCGNVAYFCALCVWYCSVAAYAKRHMSHSRHAIGILCCFVFCAYPFAELVDLCCRKIGGWFLVLTDNEHPSTGSLIESLKAGCLAGCLAGLLHISLVSLFLVYMILVKETIPCLPKWLSLLAAIVSPIIPDIILRLSIGKTYDLQGVSDQDKELAKHELANKHILYHTVRELMAKYAALSCAGAVQALLAILVQQVLELLKDPILFELKRVCGRNHTDLRKERGLKKNAQNTAEYVTTVGMTLAMVTGLRPTHNEEAISNLLIFVTGIGLFISEILTDAALVWFLIRRDHIVSLQLYDKKEWFTELRLWTCVLIAMLLLYCILVLPGPITAWGDWLC